MTMQCEQSRALCDRPICNVDFAPFVDAPHRGPVRPFLKDLPVVQTGLNPGITVGDQAQAKDLSVAARARLRAALNHIAMHFHDPGLTVTTVARRQGVSARYIQRLIEAAGTSFTAYINELRLQQAFELLTAPRTGTHRITDIALQVGFSDISHFNRLFRSRFGKTPKAVRAGAS
jgi:AraC-like DNA-binding protein